MRRRWWPRDGRTLARLFTDSAWGTQVAALASPWCSTNMIVRRSPRSNVRFTGRAGRRTLCAAAIGSYAWWCRHSFPVRVNPTTPCRVDESSSRSGTTAAFRIGAGESWPPDIREGRKSTVIVETVETAR